MDLEGERLRIAARKLHPEPDPSECHKEGWRAIPMEAICIGVMFLRRLGLFVAMRVNKGLYSRVSGSISSLASVPALRYPGNLSPVSHLRCRASPLRELDVGKDTDSNNEAVLGPDRKLSAELNYSDASQRCSSGSRWS